jgi:hypothetical protein
MKVDFFTRLVDSHKIKDTVKRNNNFMCIKTEKLKFVDISNSSKRKAFSLISVKCCKQDFTVSLVSPSVTKQMGSV